MTGESITYQAIMKYIAILRGINVSGQKKIIMKDLKQLLETLDCSDVITYIQSGNVICEYTGDAVALKIDIEEAIVKQYGFDVPVLVRTSADYQRIIDECPFGKVDLVTEGTKVLLTFLAEVPSDEACAELMTHVKSPEQLVIKGHQVYLHCPNGYGRSKLSNVFLEKKLKVQATTRNWKTINKLCELSQ